MNPSREEIRRGAIFVRDGIIDQVGVATALPATADEVLDLQERHVVLPGLVNTHHHFYQTLTRAVPAGRTVTCFNGSRPSIRSGRPDGEGVYVSAQMAAAELIALRLHDLERSPLSFSQRLHPR